MQITTPSNEDSGYHVKVDPAGRVLVPASVRARHNIRVGDMLVIRSHNGAVELRTYEQAARDAQDYFCGLVEPGRVLSLELIAERRREAETE